MRLFRFGAHEQEKPGVVRPDGTMLDVSTFGEDYTEKFFATDGPSRLAEWVQANESTCPQFAEKVR